MDLWCADIGVGRQRHRVDGAFADRVHRDAGLVGRGLFGEIAHRGLRAGGVDGADRRPWAAARTGRDPSYPCRSCRSAGWPRPCLTTVRRVGACCPPGPPPRCRRCGRCCRSRRSAAPPALVAAPRSWRYVPWMVSPSAVKVTSSSTQPCGSSSDPHAATNRSQRKEEARNGFQSLASIHEVTSSSTSCLLGLVEHLVVQLRGTP